jgi:uncharacterized protein
MLETGNEESETEALTFEFDPEKSARTKADPNRGIDFAEARQLWNDPDRLEIPLPFSAEPRRAIVGRIRLKLWTAIVTDRHKKIRIISIRRAHKKEEELYEGKG